MRWLSDESAARLTCGCSSSLGAGATLRRCATRALRTAAECSESRSVSNCAIPGRSFSRDTTRSTPSRKSTATWPTASAWSTGAEEDPFTSLAGAEVRPRARFGSVGSAATEEEVVSGCTGICRRSQCADQLYR